MYIESVNALCLDAGKEIMRRLSQIVIDIVAVVNATATNVIHRTSVIFDGFPCITSSKVVDGVTLLLKGRKDSFPDPKRVIAVTLDFAVRARALRMLVRIRDGTVDRYDWCCPYTIQEYLTEFPQNKYRIDRYYLTIW